VKAVVMAGGEGTRLRPLTSNQPKPMVPVAGKPCMEHIIDLLRRHGMSDIVVTVAYLPQVIRGTSTTAVRWGRAALLGRGDAAWDGRQREERRGAARRDVPRHLGRRPVRLRPRRPRRGAQAARGGGDARALFRREPARVRRCHHRLGGAGRAVPREAVLGPGVLGHDQHRRLRARAGVLAAVPTGRPTTSPSSCSPTSCGAASRLRAPGGRLLAGHRNLDQYRKANFDALDGRISSSVGDPPARQRRPRRRRPAP
jgi:hypothetical protein